MSSGRIVEHINALIQAKIELATVPLGFGAGTLAERKLDRLQKKIEQENAYLEVIFAYITSETYAKIMHEAADRAAGIVSAPDYDAALDKVNLGV